MPYWNFEYTKPVIYTVVKVGGGTGQDPATEVTHLRLNQPPVFSSESTSVCENPLNKYRTRDARRCVFHRQTYTVFNEG